MKYLVTNPLNYFFALLVLTFLVFYFTKLKWYWKLVPVAFLAVSFWVLTPTGANSLADSIRDPSLRAECDTTKAVVMTESHNARAASGRDFGVLTSSTLANLDRARQWAAAGDARQVIIAGPDSGDRETDELDLAYNYATLTGLPASSVARNTTGGSPVSVAADLAADMEAETITLIDTDIHSRRNATVFQAAGFRVCSLASRDSQFSVHVLRSLVPSAQSIGLAEAVIWEMVGILWFWLMG